ncbi:MAG: hypothetical protein ACO1SV_09320 [Fimbriimonas sp.]
MQYDHASVHMSFGMFGKFEWKDTLGAERNFSTEIETLNHATQEGWEMVAATATGAGALLYFKRPHL